MLRVTLEMVPFGQENRKRTIGTLDIANTDAYPSDLKEGNYKFEILENNITREGTLKKWERKLGAWQLVQACLQCFHGSIPFIMAWKNWARV